LIPAVDTHYLLCDISAFLSDKGGFKPRCHAPCLPWISGDLNSKLPEKTPVSMIAKEPKDVRSGQRPWNNGEEFQQLCRQREIAHLLRREVELGLGWLMG